MRSFTAMNWKRCCQPQRCELSRQHNLFLSSEARKTSATHAFDRSMKRLQRDNAARAHRKWHGSYPVTSEASTFPNEIVRYDYLRDEVAARLVDRLDDIRREEGFPLALDLGAGASHVYRAICADDALQSTGGGIGGVRKLVQLDSSDGMLHRDANIEFSSTVPSVRCDTYRLVADEEARLPFPDGTFDLVTSCASLHWVNQLPAVLSEIHRVLKPDGCFLWAMVGGAMTLSELRASLVLAEQERAGGVSPHVGPFVQLADVGALLQRAGFSLPTIDTDTLHVAYPNAAVLMEHLQRMGEANACLHRRQRTSLDIFLATACVYDHLFGFVDGSDGQEERAVEASVQVIYAIGWTPHQSQQKPKARGTATHKVGDMVEQSIK
jgi:NADH dehydrogenase [ubiquinone] 1 alpha subcomplex assembly factor 5